MIIERIYSHARRAPERTAIVWSGRPVSYLRFARAIETMRARWQAQSLPAGSTAVVVANLLESWPCVLALQSLGLRTVCAPSLEAARALALRNVSCFVLCRLKASENWQSLSQWIHLRQLFMPANLYGPIPEGAHPLPDTPAVAGGGHILYSSGTTGRYKQLFHDAALDDQRCAQRAAAEQIDARSVTNTAYLDLWTAAGYRRPLVSWHVGGCAVFDQRPDWPLHLGEHGVTHAILTPGMVDEALAVLRLAGCPLGGWSFELIVGGAPLSTSTLDAVHEHLTPNLSIVFGSTELGVSALRSRVTTPDDLQWLSPWNGREVQIVSEDGQPCADGVEGPLRVRLSPLDYTSYLDDPDSTARMFHGGWFHPGDVAVRRTDGRIRILGRTSDVINVNGRKTASGPIEEAICAALGASAVCAFSGPDASGVDRVVLAVEIGLPASVQQLQQAAANHPGLKDVRFVQLRNFPRTRSGTRKIDRVRLRQQVMALQHPTSAPAA